MHLEPLRVLTYAQVAQAGTYRAIMWVFASAKRRFVIQLRPADVQNELARLNLELDFQEESIETYLESLTTWGNLRRTHDTATAQTLEEFQRRRALYQMTPQGEAAEQAISKILDAIGHTGSLQRVMFVAIMEKLRRLQHTAKTAPDDSAALFPILNELFSDFASLTENASLFLTNIQQALDSEQYDTETFRIYKSAVIEYLDTFIDELHRQQDVIRAAIEDLEGRNITAIITTAARETAAPTLDGKTTDMRAQYLEKWRGLRVWFLGEASGPPTAEALRAAATTSIDRMLRVLNHLNDQRFQRITRVADFLQLAGWFNQLVSDEDAHALFRDAFGLAGPRHLTHLPGQDDAQTNGSWHTSPPVRVPWAERVLARPSRAGRPAKCDDYQETKRLLEERRREQEQLMLDGLRPFIGQGRLDSRNLPTLTHEGLAALLDFLDAGLTTKVAPGRYSARSHDGDFIVTLEFPQPSDTVTISTDDGRLTSPFFFLTVEDSRP